MKYGDRGKKVAELKKFLHEKEYPVNCDCDLFDEDTLLALIHYQHHKGHRTTGKIREFDFNCLEGKKLEDSNRSSKKNGSEIFFCQKALKQLGFYMGNLDGLFGDKTSEACKNFQKSSGLKSDGIIGPKTLLTLKDHLSFITLPAAKRPIIKLSDKGDYVRMLQGCLKASGFYQGEECGTFDSNTHEAVCRFQDIANILENEGKGVVSEKTWEALDWYFYL